MVKITESTREEVENVLSGLEWILDFWNDKMRLISIEGGMDRDQFLVAKDTGIKFMESFVVPMAENYERKLHEFPVKVVKDLGMEVNGGNSSDEGPISDSFLNGVPSSGRRGRKPGSKNKPKDGYITLTPVGEDKILVPDSLKPVPTAVIEPEILPVPSVTVVGAPEGPVTYAYRRPHTKHRKSFKGGELTIEQRDKITERWVENNGVMTDLKCSELAKEMGFGGPNQVQGWVSYLTKVVNNNPSYDDRAKGWKYIISSGKISDRPVPNFFLGKVEVAFTTRPKASV